MNKILKRLFCIALAAVMLCGALAGCSARAPEEETTEAETTTTEPTTPTTTEDPATTFPENETRKIYPALEKDAEGSYPYKIAEYSTYYNGNEAERTANLKVAANRVNNLVVKSGEVFSFNQNVGKRTVTAGYATAKVISDGEFVDGLGGGVCQVSSTIFQCVLRANVKIVARSYHSLEIGYVPLGGDATVQWNSVDFQFENSLNTDIRLVMYAGSGKLTCEAWAKDNVDVGDVKIEIKADGKDYVLNRYVDGVCNYTTRSRYAKPKPKEKPTEEDEEEDDEKDEKDEN